MSGKRTLVLGGASGLVGRAIAERLSGHTVAASSRDVNLMDMRDTERFFMEIRPTHVFMAAGRVGGIEANRSRPAQFIHDNLSMAVNVVESCRLFNVEKLVYLGSSCIFPRACEQPMKEEHLLTGALEPTNEWYAVAKIAGIKLCQAYKRQYNCNFVSAMPCNLYGPNDNFDLTSSHVLPAMIRKFHEAKVASASTVTLWGNGSALREFLHVHDLADALMVVMDKYNEEQFINVGSGQEVSIKELAEAVQSIVYPGSEIVWDTSKPNGMPRKIMDSSRMRTLGWTPKIDLRQGIGSSYEWYRSTVPVK